MKISGVWTAVVALPADEPLADAPNNPGGSRPTVVLRLRTDQGLEGIGITYLGAALTRSLHHTTHALAELTIGDDPTDIPAIRKKLFAAAGGSGPEGIFSLALAALDIALWDIAGKAKGEPLWKLLGAPDVSVPCYASGALMRELRLEGAVKAARRLFESGFTAMKFQLGLPGPFTFDAEIERARLIREATGDEVALMCDVNQRWRLEEALQLGPRLDEYSLTWLEDPIAYDDVGGLVQLGEALKTDIAAGEYLYRPSAFRHMLEAGALDVAMIDPFRAGGITGWLEIAELANRFGKRVVSHLAPEVQLHLIGAIPNGWIVEYMPWFNAVYEEVVWPVNGMLTMPEKPGLGVAFDRRALARYSIEETSSPPRLSTYGSQTVYPKERPE
jgi:L-alanine-DL-glutamate epimerase-like enolase superfamily enzyme